MGAYRASPATSVVMTIQLRRYQKARSRRHDSWRTTLIWACFLYRTILTQRVGYRVQLALWRPKGRILYCRAWCLTLRRTSRTFLDKKRPTITWLDEGVTLGVVVASSCPLDWKAYLCRKAAGDIITYAGLVCGNGRHSAVKWWQSVLLVTTAGVTVSAAQEKSYDQLKK